MMNIEREKEVQLQLPKIEALARRFYASLDFAHNESHGERVVSNALLLHANEGGVRAVVLAGAWLHQFHDNLTELAAGLGELALSEAARRQLQEIVEVCRPQKISSEASLEARIVFDADALDLIGPFGTVRELLCNFHHRNLSWDETVEGCRLVQGLFVERLQTDSARAMARDSISANAKFWAVYRDELERTKHRPG